MSDHQRVEQALRGVKVRGRVWIRVPCPFCQDEGHKDTKASLAINAGSGYYTCWRCQEHGSLPDPPDPEQAAITEFVDRHEPSFMEAPPFYTELGDPTLLWPFMAREYLRNDRKISDKAIKAAHVGVIDDTALEEAARSMIKLLGIRSDLDEWKTAKRDPSQHAEQDRVDLQTPIGLSRFGWSWRNRVIVPHMHEDGKRWLGWFGRSILKDEKRMKHLYPKGMSRELLWNYKLLNDETTDTPIFAVEGCLDALYLWPDAVAFMGSPAHAHEGALLNSKRPVIVMLDGDVHEKGEMLALKLKFNGQRAGSIRLGPKTDPDEVPIDVLVEAGKRCLESGKPVAV